MAPRVNIDVSKFEETLRKALDDLVRRSKNRDPEAAIARWEGLRGTLSDSRIDSLIKLEREGGDPYTQDKADLDIKHFTKETRSNMGKLSKGVLAALKRAGRWMGSDVTIKAQEYNRDSEDMAQESGHIYVHKGALKRNSPDFLLFGDGDLGDVLDASDQDFFTDPAVESDYFTLVQEIRRPGSTKSKGRTIILYTARPEKDRRVYEGARTVPSGIFLTTSYTRAEGLGSDLSGGRGRDIWRVKIKDTHLLQTLKAPSAQDFQAYHPSGKVPVESTELISEQSRLAKDRTMTTAFDDLVKLAYDNPGPVRDALLPILKRASRNKTANWWGTLLIDDGGDGYSLFVGGENPAGGWHSYQYMAKEMNGRLKKLADDVVKVLKGAGFDVKGGMEIFGTAGKNDNYIGRKFYGRKPRDIDLVSLMREKGPKAYIKTDVGF